MDLTNRKEVGIVLTISLSWLATSRGRKGTGWNAITNLLEQVDSVWFREKVKGGIPSGEAIITAVRDPNIKTNSKSRSVEDPGVTDKRLLLMEEEFQRLLSVRGRNGNTISEVLRLAWDNPMQLSVAGKHDPEKATKPHISFIGHVTRDELLANFKSVEQGNGFGNRILWVASRRTKKLSRPKWIEWRNKHPEIIEEILEVVKTFGEEVSPNGRVMNFSQKGETAWDKFYESIDDSQIASIGKLLARAEAHVLRFSMIYTALDNSASIEPKHIRAAIAVWDYCVSSTKWIFGGSTGNLDSDKVLKELKHRSEGMTRTEIQDEVFHRHKTASDVSEALRVLLENKLAYFTTTKAENGKLVERWFHRLSDASSF